MAILHSADGSMEIKHNIQTGATEFVTYIGGDGYTAPIALESDGTPASPSIRQHWASASFKLVPTKLSKQNKSKTKKPPQAGPSRNNLKG